uniref:Erythrocyte membrane protein band 4.1 like 3 n=1 Tax=Fundulus heteroclitus TaxID=8078 RepID=A0A3Q2STG2_FUNHE
MTTESGADSEAKQPQAKKEAEKEKTKAAGDPASPQKQPEQLPAAVGHSTPARKEQVRKPEFVVTVSINGFIQLLHLFPSYQEQPEEDQESHRSSTSRLSKSPLRGVKKVKMMQCKIALLDGTDYTVNVEKRAKGHVLFDKVCDHLNLLEKDYFGITYRDVENQKNWLDPTKELKKQIRTGPWNFAFNVKFYPPDPSQLSEDITRYYLCLQLRDDVVSGRLPCSFATHTVLGSYTVQSELGDYDPDELGSDYISEIRFAPNQTKELEEKVMELHKTYKGMTPAEAEIHFLENAKKLSMYGVDLHHAKDSEGVEIMLGVCASGLLIYRDRLRINRFAWPKILKISYKRNNFYIKIRPGEFEQFESTIGFKLPNHRAAKRLWKVCVEHHTFFRLVSPEVPPKKFLSLGSKFRYSGRTQAQTRRASAQIARPAPLFERSSSKRYNMSRSLDGGEEEEEEPTPLERTDFACDGEMTATEVCISKSKSAKGEKTFVAKHQTNISELKRSFLETDGGGGAPGLTEWEKRLSSSPLRSPRADEAPMIEPLELQDVSCRLNDGMSVCSMTSAKDIFIKMQAAGIIVVISSLWEYKPIWASESAGDKTPDSQEEEEVSDRSMVKVSPGAVRQEVSQAISDKKGTLIIFKQAENKEDTEYDGTSEKEGLAVSAGSEADGNQRETEASAAVKGQTSVVKMLSPAVEIKTGDGTQIKGIDSPKKAMASWISEEKVEISEVTSVFTKEAHDGGEVVAKDVPVVHTETKTITYESAEADTNGDADPGVLLSAQTITSETTSTTTTTHITKTVKGGISETRIEKRIVITGDADIDHDEALAQAIKEAKEQHPDMSVTKVVVHKETEITPEEGED